MKAMDLSRIHEVTGSGQAIGGEERLAIHKTHRLGAVVASVLVLLATLAALLEGSRYRAVAIVLLLLLVSEFTIGVSAILSSIPIGLAVAHNWFAGLLLLALLKLLALGSGSRSAREG
jgi:cytochrome c oxidase assembly protein subunit 15